jgi:hypothetical protein
MGVLQILHPKHGDLRHEWSPDRPEEVELARKTFNEALAKGMMIYKMDEHGEKTGVQIREFDPKIRRMIAMPAMRGG